MADIPTSNPFTQLDLPIRFDLDASTIERAYLTKLASAHPDAGGGQLEHGDAASLNAARTILLDAEQRANALLAVLGGPSASACKDLPDGFLMEMMTRREEIEEQIDQADNQTDNQAGDQARANWESWAHDERVSYTDSVSEKFGSLPRDESSTERAHKLRDIRTLLNAWRYIERLIEQLDPAYDPASADFRQ